MAQEIADSTLLDTWGSSGAKIEPDISKIIEGWQLGEQPPHEYMNWLQNTFGSKLNHILKNGVASWNNETEYLAGSSVQHNGNVWLCKTTNTNSAPTDANANWKRIITVESLTTVLNGYVKLSGNQTIAGVKTFSSTISGSISGNAATATNLATARTINGTSFDGTANITTARWGTARTITIGAAGKSVNGSDNVRWAHTEIGVDAATANTLALRDSSGDITARLFRSEYAHSSSINASYGVMMQANNTTDNYIRPITAAGFKAWMQDNNLHIGAYEHSKSLASNGYMRFTNGLIIQWLSFTTKAVGNATYNFPIAFPTACLTAVQGNKGALQASFFGIVGFTTNNVTINTTSTTQHGYILAIGY